MESIFSNRIKKTIRKGKEQEMRIKTDAKTEKNRPETISLKERGILLESGIKILD